jgi:hypothetical protein
MKPRAVGLETARSMRVSCGVRPTGRASDCMICHNLMAIGINAEAAWRHFDAPINEREHGEETAKRLPGKRHRLCNLRQARTRRASRKRLSDPKRKFRQCETSGPVRRKANVR